jgi:molybdate transport system regulatory protein
MMISARNQIDVRVEQVQVGLVNTLVSLRMEQGTFIEAAITRNGSDELNLKAGDRVIAFFKASHVLIATGWAIPISASNKLEGAVETVLNGVVNAEVTIRLSGGDRLIATVTYEAVKNLALKEGVEVAAIIQASDVMIAKANFN